MLQPIIKELFQQASQ